MNVFAKCKSETKIWINEKLSPKTSDYYLNCAKGKFSDVLTYDQSFLDDDGREIIQLSDGAIGTMWKLRAISHEILSEAEVDYKLKQINKIFEKLVSKSLSIQVYFVKENSSQFNLPKYYDSPQNYAQKVVKNRIDSFKDPNSSAPDLINLDIYICMRLDPSYYRRLFGNKELTASLGEEIRLFNEDLSNLRVMAETLENGYTAKLGEDLERVGAGELIYFLRKILHQKEGQSGNFFKKDASHSSQVKISETLLKGSIEWRKDAIGVGDDTYEVMSWQTQPYSIYPGLMNFLLQIKGDFYAVMNLRPKNYHEDLEQKSEEAKGADPRQKRQKIQFDEANDRVAGGEKLINASFHIIYRNEGIKLEGDKSLRRANQVARDISDTIPMFVEDQCAYLAFVACLPFMYSKKIAPLLGRERRILSADLGYMLPLLGGMRGAREPKQLMQSRAGEQIWLNNREAPSNPHFAVYGESGSGKSFFMANHIVAEFAYDKDLITIMVDSLTSYKYLAKAIGEDYGSSIITPPSSFPNIFYGEIADDRLAVITSTIKVAVSLISKEEISAPEEVLLSDSIVYVSRANIEAASREYVVAINSSKLGSFEDSNQKRRVVRLSDVVNVFAVVAANNSLSKDLVDGLVQKLLPFYGSGPYANIFDQLQFEQKEERSPAFILYDLADIQDDANLCAITTLLLIAETERIIKHPLNAGRRGNLIFEEAQTTLNSKNPVLTDYIKGAYARFRKLGWACGCIGNMIDAFSELSGPKAAWDLSATKILLPLTSESEQSKLIKLLKIPYHCELASSLVRVSGKYSQFLYLANPVKGSGIYVSTGHDYWLSSNERYDCEAIEYVAEKLQVEKTYQDAIDILANYSSGGFRDEFGSLRSLSKTERRELGELAVGINQKFKGEISEKF